MTSGADAGEGSMFLARLHALEREAARLRDAIEHARAATGEDGRAYGRRLNEENEALRRENAELEAKLRALRARRRPVTQVDPLEVLRLFYTAVRSLWKS